MDLSPLESTMIDVLQKRAKDKKPKAELDLEALSFDDLNPEAKFTRLYEDGQQSTEESFSVKKLFSRLQNKFSSSQDVAELIESEVQLRTADLYQKANFDPLTHLPNRRFFHEILDQLVQRFSEYNHPFSLLFLDLDGFKQVNDNQGHKVGDELLRHVAARLVASVREGDVVSRLGGDEFVILLSDTDDDDIVSSVCNRILRETSRPYWFDGVEVLASTSIGVACYPRDSKTTNELLDHADKALYMSKSQGKKRYSFFKTIQENIGCDECLLKLESAIKQNELVVYVEPKLDLKNEQIQGLEMSVLWEGVEAEKQFYHAWAHLLEASDWEHSVGLWLIDSACFYLKKWQVVEPKIFVSVPVMGAVWRADDFLPMLEKAVETYQLDKSKLRLEFSLKEFDGTGVKLEECIKSLIDSGFTIHFTDLGLYPLDLSLLMALTPVEFSLDSEWLKASIQTEAGQQWVRGLVHMSHALGAKLTAHVDSESELQQVLVSLGVDLLQSSDKGQKAQFFG